MEPTVIQPHSNNDDAHKPDGMQEPATHFGATPEPAVAGPQPVASSTSSFAAMPPPAAAPAAHAMDMLASTPPTPPTPPSPSEPAFRSSFQFTPMGNPDAPAAPTPTPAAPGMPPVAPGPQPPTPPAPGGASAAGYGQSPDQWFAADSQRAGMPTPQPFYQGMAARPKSRKKWLAVGGLVALVLLLSGGYTFAFYLPGLPANVYKTGMNRTGKAVNSLVTQATNKSNIDAFSKSELTLTGEADYSDTSYSGQLSTKFDQLNSNSNLDFTLKANDGTSKTLNAKVLTQSATSGSFPNIYFQVTGLKALGLDDFVPGISQYDGQWISVDAQYLESLGVTPGEVSTSKQPTSDDIAQLAQAVTTDTQNYVFTTDPAKAVLEEKNFVGKETINGIKTYHYVMGLNKTHAIAYCKAVVTTFYNSNVAKKMFTSSSLANDEKQSQLDSCDSNTDISSSNTFDMWIDSKYKLVYKVRFTDKSQKDTYVDVGQTYTGGNKVSLFVNYHDGELHQTGTATIDLNMDSKETKGTLTLDSSDPDNIYSLKFTLDAKPYTGSVDVQKPAGAVPIQNVIQRLMPQDAGGAGTFI